VLGEITTDTLIVALNKVDLLTADVRAAHVAKVRRGHVHAPVPVCRYLCVDQCVCLCMCMCLCVRMCLCL
jgi:hypothetical protein